MPSVARTPSTDVGERSDAAFDSGRDGGLRWRVDDFVAEFRLDFRAEAALRGAAPSVQERIIDRAAFEECANP
eukprot:gene1438-3438_t